MSVISARSLLATAALFALTMALAAGPAAARQAPLPELPTQAAEHDEELQVRPATISFTGDGTGYVGGRTTSPRHYGRGGIRWLSWTQRSAFGRGYVWISDCRPYCAAGHFHKHRGTVRATRARHGLFTRLKIVYRWGGRRVQEHRVLEHTPSYTAGGKRYPGFYYWGRLGLSCSFPTMPG